MIGCQQRERRSRTTKSGEKNEGRQKKEPEGSEIPTPRIVIGDEVYKKEEKKAMGYYDIRRMTGI